MAMQKANEVREDVTPCDVCSRPATLVTREVALCSGCASSKRAEDTGCLLKHASLHLAGQYKPKGS